jgi:hypothetical protein
VTRVAMMKDARLGAARGEAPASKRPAAGPMAGPGVAIAAPTTGLTVAPHSATVVPAKQTLMAAKKNNDRQSVVERSAHDGGEQWARGWRTELQSDHRRASGGWPGTIAQARVCARAHLSAELARLRLAAPSSMELEQAARLTYARARAVWLALAHGED